MDWFDKAFAGKPEMRQGVRLMDWLEQAFAAPPQIPIEVLSSRIGVAFILGCLVAGVYRFTHRRDATAPPGFLATLVLLSLLISVVTQVIGDNLALAFSLAGALAIVRFRTVVEDTRDTAFVIFAVVMGMAVGTGHLTLALLGLAAGALAAAVVRSTAVDWNLTVRIGLGQDPEVLLKDFLQKHVIDFHLLATSTVRQGAALDVTYKVRFRPASTPNSALSELNRVEGIQSVELKRV